jgi:hypothetical protein
MSNREENFTLRNRGRYAIRQAGILVLRAFDTRDEAQRWAEENYRVRNGWQIEQL